MKLPLSTRATLAKEFGVAKVLPTHVSDNVVVQDGYKIEDVERSIMTIEALQSYIPSKEKEFLTLWENTVAKAEGRYVQTGITEKMVEEISAPSVIETIPPHAPEALKEPTTEKTVTHETPKKRGRKPRVS